MNIITLTLDLRFLLTALVSYLCLKRKVVNHVKNSSNINRCKVVLRHEKDEIIHSDAVSMTRILNRLIIVICLSYIPYISIGLVFSSQPMTCIQIH